MSAEALGWAYRHSPFEGATFNVHLAIADSINDQNSNEFWMSVENLARKARAGERTARSSLRILADQGFLLLLEERDGKTSRYEFLFPDIPVVFESRRGVPGRPPAGSEKGGNLRHDPGNLREKGGNQTRKGGQPQPPNPRRTQEVLLLPPNSLRSSGQGDDSPEKEDGARELIEALWEVFGLDPDTMTSREHANVKAAKTQLRDAGAWPELIPLLIDHHNLLGTTWDLTVNSIPSHYSRLKKGSNHPNADGKTTFLWPNLYRSRKLMDPNVPWSEWTDSHEEWVNQVRYRYEQMGSHMPERLLKK